MVEARQTDDFVLHRTRGRVLPRFNLDASRPEACSAADVVASGDIRAFQKAFDQTDAAGRCEFIALEAGLFLMILDIDLPRGHRTFLVGEDLVEFHFRLSGDMTLEGEWGQVRLSGQSLLIWRQPKGHEDVFEELHGGGRVREISVTVYCDRGRLARLLGQEAGEVPAHEALLDGCATRPIHQVVEIGPEAAAVLQGILRDRQPGPLRLLRMKARGYELLAAGLQASRAAAPMGRRPFSKRDIACLEEARRRLEAEHVAPPTVSSLAQQVGMNLSKLSQGLKARYGLSASEIVREARLTRAYHLLETTDLQVSQIAAAVGYAHHSTLSAAFALRFGGAPKTLAKALRLRRGDLMLA